MTLELKVGGVYRDRKGRKVGPLRWGEDNQPERPFEYRGLLWSRSGKRYRLAGHPDTDIVAEWTAEDDVIAEAAAAIPPKAAKPDTMADLLDQREKVHGEFWHTAQIARELKDVIAKYAPADLDPVYREALDMDASKTARILSGNPHEVDHWRDKAGYATLGERFARAKSDV